MLQNIKIVLVETSHSGNIGSVARAMKTMGLTELYLVSPQQKIDEQALALSANADDVLNNAVVVEDFATAIEDCHLVIGTSARSRHLANTLVNARECGKLAINSAEIGKVAIVFGRERVGLTNEELLKCHYHLMIPANPDYSSLNLAMAVQLVSYEIRMAWLAYQQEHKQKTQDKKTRVTSGELEYLLTHTEQVYRQLGFIQNQGVMKKLRRFYYASNMEKNTLNILHGMLTAVEQRIGHRD